MYTTHYMKRSQIAFTTFEICEKMKIRQERLREWIDRGFVKPSVQSAQGRGTKNLFSQTDLYLIETFRCLIRRGFSRKEAGSRIADLALYRDSPLKLKSVGIIGLPKKIDEPYKRVNERPQPWKFKKNVNAPYDAHGDVIYPGVLAWREGEQVVIDFSPDYQMIDDVLVINFSKIRKQVDTAFGLKS